MHIAKLRVRDETGLVPAGRYFQQVAKSLRAANAREHARAEAEDRGPKAVRRYAPVKFAEHPPM